MIGANTTVTLEHLATGRDAHGAKTDGAADETHPGLGACISRASLGNLWRITVDGDWQRIGEAPSEWRLTDAAGRVFSLTRATYRPPVGRIDTSEHTLLFAELHDEIEVGVEI